MEDNTATGNAVYHRVSPTEERFWSPWGSRVHDHTGLHERTFHGAKLDLGGLGLPAPFSAFGSMGSMSADMIFMQGALVSLGLDQGLTMAALLLPVAGMGVTLELFLSDEPEGRWAPWRTNKSVRSWACG